jgi:hypothetical protein
MSMEEIQKAISRLKTQGDTLDAGQADVKKKVHRLIRDLERQLENPDNMDHGHMIGQIETAVTALETEHPAITGILNGIATTLSNMGI